jgi:hypothetical protein
MEAAMLIAQGLGEYAGIAGSAVGAGASSPLHNTMNWLQHSWNNDRGLWIAAIACVLLGIWLFSRRHG